MNNVMLINFCVICKNARFIELNCFCLELFLIVILDIQYLFTKLCQTVVRLIVVAR